MVHVAKQLYLPQRPLGVDVVVERIANLLDRNLLPRLRVNSRADNAVGAAADGADGRGVLGGNLEEVAVHVVEHVAPPRASPSP
uniref:Simk1 n=1 Tax=Arundo donax TaxID=35708 RepID=A0A0A9EXV1_ARUDO